MIFVAVHPQSPSRALTAAILEAGYRPVPVADVDEVEAKEPEDGWVGAIVDLTTDPGLGPVVARKLRDRLPVLVVADRLHTADLEELVGAFDDFVLTPIDAVELRIRLAALPREGRGAVDRSEILTFEDLELNTATYQASLAGEPLDLTYMEYELLRFFVEHPRRVWSREQILARVWGYDYFGGSRTVDVHVRRLRAKLGETRASWITTVRSVGYRFG
ncbi:MAG TPA: response regulator transcription factor [Actinobacteria bacterium]|nr:response regulator transcription factor [Actinomycetota bacterium]